MVERQDVGDVAARLGLYRPQPENDPEEEYIYGEDCGWTSLWDEFYDHGREVQRMIDSDHSWSWNGAGQGKGRSTCEKGVRFKEEIDVYLVQDEMTCRYELNLATAHEILRKCWTMNWGSSSFALANEILTDYVAIRHHGQEDGHERNADAGSDNCQGGRNDQDSGIEQVRSLYLHSLANGQRVQNVETWYVCGQRMEQCKFSRVVTVLPTHNFDDFLQRCRQVWRDVVERGDFHWSVVRETPSTRVSTRAHIILAQRSEPHHTYHLVHWDRWPILSKFRAQIIDWGESVSATFGRGNLWIPRAELARPAITYNDNGNALHLDQNDRIRVQASSVMYAYVQHVEEAETSDEEDSSSDDDESTAAPSDQGSEEEETDEISWTAMHGLVSCFDHHGPYPWEQDDPPLDNEIEEEDEMDDIEFGIEDEFQMMQHIRFMNAEEEPVNPNWVAVTFGVALADLGRRDLAFSIDQIEVLAAMIQNLWQDHIRFGRAKIYFVMPQPEALHPGKYLVFLVVVEYGEALRDDSRWVLVRERSPDQTVVRRWPYGAVVFNQITPRALMAQIGHQECFPFGVRDCKVRLAGRWLEDDTVYEIPNGALCDAYVAAYPDNVQRAEERIEGAEALFRIARSYFEISHGSVLMTLRIHAISPLNQPLGYRDVPVDYPDLHTLDWIQTVYTLWPFNEDFAACYYVPRGSFFQEERHEQPVLHFILNYATEPEGCPVLVHQTLHSVNEDKNHEELWATIVPREASEDRLRHALQRHPFWFHPAVRTHMERDGKRIQVAENEIQTGDVLALRVNVVAMQYLLGGLWEMHDPSNDLLLEEVTMLQLFQQRSRSDEDEVGHSFTKVIKNIDGPVSMDPFVEICAACMHWSPSETDIGCLTQNRCSSEGNADVDTEDVDAQARYETFSTTTPIVLSLELTLAEDAPKLHEAEQMLQWFKYDNWKEKVRQEWQDALQWLPEGMHIHPTTWHALHEQDVCQHDVQDQIHLYIDGSMQAGQGGWAVVVVEFAQGRAICRGMIGGTIVTDPKDEKWVGAERASNVTAELTALIVAQMFALAAATDLPIIIRPDLALSKQIADLQVSTTYNQIMSSVSASLARMDQGKTQVNEIRAHLGNPWNELADCVAKHAAKTGSQIGTVPWNQMKEFVHETQEREWAWWQDANDAMRQAFPPLHQNLVMQIPGPDCQKEVVLSRDATPDYNATFQISTCSINVLALDEKESGYQGSRSLRLDTQMHERDINMIGLQEARTVKGQRVTDHYTVFSSGGSGLKGKQFLGCEVWLHKFKPLLTTEQGQNFFLKDFQVATVCADERRMMLYLTGPINLLLASLHAPCLSSRHSATEIQAWWNETSRVLAKYRHGNIIVCCDANAPLADEETSSYGLNGSEEMNAQGFMFQDFLLENQLAVPSTFDVHSGSHGTWKHPRGSLLRRDYVLVAGTLLPAVTQSQVIQDCDLGFSHTDHFPILCNLRCLVRVGGKDERIKWDRLKFKDQEICKRFQRRLSQSSDASMECWHWHAQCILQWIRCFK